MTDLMAIATVPSATRRASCRNFARLLQATLGDGTDATVHTASRNRTYSSLTAFTAEQNNPSSMSRRFAPWHSVHFRKQGSSALLIGLTVWSESRTSCMRHDGVGSRDEVSTAAYVVVGCRMIEHEADGH